MVAGFVKGVIVGGGCSVGYSGLDALSIARVIFAVFESDDDGAASSTLLALSGPAKKS